MKETLHNWIDSLFAYAQPELLVMSVIIGLFTLALLRLQYQMRFERQRREETDRQLLNALQRITHLEDEPAGQDLRPTHFEQDLNHAELKNRLQAPATQGNAPDKYRHVASLAQQGMAVEQIAEVLNISLPEANQLVSLSRLAPKHD